jgi:hypothetical protein
VQLEFWFNEHPDRLQKHLREEDRGVRQWVVWVAAQGDSRMTYTDPAIVRELIDGLRDDSISFNHRIFPHFLLRHPAETEPELRKAFESSNDLQQKKILQEILTEIKNRQESSPVRGKVQ